MGRINQMEPVYGKEEAQACYDYIMSGGWCSDHVKTRELEAEICKVTGAKYCSVVPNGTVALELVCRTIQPIKPLIAVPAYTMAASPYSVSMAGGKILPIDINPDTLCMDPGKLLKAMERWEPDAVMHVSINGRHGDISEIRNVCLRFNVPLIEDACQALGSFHQGKHLGTFGNIGVLSLNTFKIISTGQGGAMITDFEAYYNTFRKWKDFGRLGGRGAEYSTLGTNAKFTDIQAVIGLEQMKKLPDRMKRKKEMYWHYIECLAGWEKAIQPINTNLDDCSPWYMDFMCHRRDELLAWLGKHDIEAQPFYPIVPELSYYRRQFKDNKYPGARKVSDAGIWLPSSMKLTDEDIERVCKEIINFYKEVRSNA